MRMYREHIFTQKEDVNNPLPPPPSLSKLQSFVVSLTSGDHRQRTDKLEWGKQAMFTHKNKYKLVAAKTELLET